MQPHERIAAAITAANDDGRAGLVPFITAGYPDPATFCSSLQAIAVVGDVVELGVPFSDPMADGMTIQRSSFAAIENGVTLTWIFEQLDQVQGSIDAPLIMMSYLNPLLAFGYERLASRAKETGVCAFIVPDLPYEESAELSTALDAEGVGRRPDPVGDTGDAGGQIENAGRRITRFPVRGDHYRHNRRRYGTTS
jgi:tryptophan synthase alpha chain